MGSWTTWNGDLHGRFYLSSKLRLREFAGLSRRRTERECGNDDRSVLEKFRWIGEDLGDCNSDKIQYPRSLFHGHSLMKNIKKEYGTMWCRIRQLRKETKVFAIGLPSPYPK